MLPNAFIGRTKEPTTKDLSTVLGDAKTLWEQLLIALARDVDLTIHEWNSYSPKAGWSFKVKQGDRTILYMSPCSGSFRVSFALGDKALKTALKSNLPSRVVKIIKEAKRYAEGTAVRIEVKTVNDIPIVTTLAAAKRDH